MRDDNLKQLLRIFPEITRKLIVGCGETYFVRSSGIAFTITFCKITIYKVYRENTYLLDGSIIEINYTYGYILTDEDLKFILIELNDYFNRPYKEKIIKTIIYESDSKN